MGVKDECQRNRYEQMVPVGLSRRLLTGYRMFARMVGPWRMLVQPAKLTILGASPAWTNPGGAGSGYLLRSQGSAIQIEAGSGTFGRLRKVIPVDQLSAVVISHVHADHCLDLVPLCYGLRYGGLVPEGTRLSVFVPPGCIDFLTRLGGSLVDDDEFFSRTFDLHEYEPGREFIVGGMRLFATRVQHYIPSFALRFEVGAGLVFSGDSAPCAELVEAARDAGTFLCEAALKDASQDNPEPEQRGHLCPAEAAQIAEQAHARRLLLTHYRTDIMTPDDVMNLARPHYSGQLAVVREGRSYAL